MIPIQLTEFQEHQFLEFITKTFTADVFFNDSVPEPMTREALKQKLIAAGLAEEITSALPRRPNGCVSISVLKPEIIMECLQKTPSGNIEKLLADLIVPADMDNHKFAVYGQYDHSLLAYAVQVLEAIPEVNCIDFMVNGGYLEVGRKRDGSLAADYLYVGQSISV